MDKDSKLITEAYSNKVVKEAGERNYQIQFMSDPSNEPWDPTGRILGILYNASRSIFKQRQQADRLKTVHNKEAFDVALNGLRDLRIKIDPDFKYRENG